ncbi:MAG: hypothetical protein V3V13_07645 [Paracoccaceae bacterium]
MNTNTAIKTPWHLWLVAALSLLWNAMGAFDYVMTQTKNAEYLAKFTPEQLAYFNSFPIWVQGTWAIAIFGSVLGSILLLLRSRHAVLAFWVAMLAMIATTAHNFILSDVKMSDVVDPIALVFTVVIFVVAVLLVYYSRRMRARGVLG